MTAHSPEYVMPEIESRMLNLELECARIDERLKTIERFCRKHDETKQQVPVLLLGAISATTAIVSVLVQLLFRGMP